MRELIACWQHTRMIVLIALCAALFVALLIPFKIASIVPGITEIRPASALPIVFSIFFGPAAAWGAAFGNTIGDFFGTISPGTLFGFLGNFVYAFAPYRITRSLLKDRKDPDVVLSGGRWAVFFFSIFLSCALCAVIIALGVDFLGIVPFSFLVQVIFLNNFLVSVVLAPLLIRLLHQRVKQMRLSWLNILRPEEISNPLLKSAGPFVLLVLVLVFYAAGMRWIPLFDGHHKIFELIASLLLTFCALILL